MSYSKPEKGTVIAIAGGIATVEFRRDSDCGACGMCHHQDDTCSQKTAVMALDVDAVEGLMIGHEVLVADAVPSSWAGALLLFAIPLAGLLAGLATGMHLFDSEPAAAGIGLLCLMLCLSGGFVADRLIRRRPKVKPRILSITGVAGPPRE